MKNILAGLTVILLIVAIHGLYIGAYLDAFIWGCFAAFSLIGAIKAGV